MRAIEEIHGGNETAARPIKEPSWSLLPLPAILLMKVKVGGRLNFRRAFWFALATAALAFCALPDGQAQSLADRLKAVQSGHEGPPPPTLPAWKPVSSATSSMAIPLVKGLIVSGAQAGDQGDREQIRSMKDVTPAAATIVVEWDAQSGSGSGSSNLPKRIITTRTVDRADLLSSHRFMGYYVNGATEHYPGAAGFGGSAEVLNQLRAGQPSEFDYAENPLAALMSGQGGLVTWNGHAMRKCTLHRVGTTDVSIPMLVNSVAVELPALHAMCSLDGSGETHLYFLDQPANPLLIASQLPEGITQMIKIDFPVNAPQTSSDSPMEQALAQKKPVQIYGIYFDFNSASLKPESEAVLKQIADILQKNPTWKLSVAGHTDNIGDSGFNQSLSERRAAAVKDALVNEYKIAPDRLTTTGYGASRPIATNATVEGRARNRRVELQRQ
jgi:outer membrane protein OmpA-like peptidoglycan-associated protein